MLTDDLDVLFSGPDSVDVVDGERSFKALFDMSEVEIPAALAISAENVILVKTSDVDWIDDEDDQNLLINGDSYRVRKTLRIDDGLLSRVFLEKIDPEEPEEEEDE